MSAVLFLLALLGALALNQYASAASHWVAPVCVGCCSHTTAVGRSLSFPLHAVRLNGSLSPVVIFAAEDPGIPVGSVLELRASNSSLALSTFTFTAQPVHSGLTLELIIGAAHDGTVTRLCFRISVLAPNPVYSPDSLNSSSSFSAAVNCPVSVTVAVEDLFYTSDVRVSRMETISPLGVVTPSIPNHVLSPLTSPHRTSLTLKFVPAFGTESSRYTACFVGGDAVGMIRLAEVCVVWVVSKCEYCSGSGETLQYIAQLYSGDSNWRRLFNLNPSLVDPDLIFTGSQRLVVGNLYRVVRGDTLDGLSQRFKSSLPSLLRLNPDVADPSSISVGQMLCVASHTFLAHSDSLLAANSSAQ
jgi:hypothetical protein